MPVASSSPWGSVLACALCGSCCPGPQPVTAGRLPLEVASSRQEPTAAPCRDPSSTDASLGQVFDSVEVFARAHQASPASDAGLRAQPVARSPFVWLVDTTPTTNGTWRLFEQLDGGGVRYLLCHVAGYWTREPFETLDDPVVLEESLQPYAAAERVTYEFSKARGYYVPAQCVTRVVVSPTSGSAALGCQASQEDAYSVLDIPWDCNARVSSCD